nr:hypothetical protein CFP56_60236 [Quercus suber]
MPRPQSWNDQRSLVVSSRNRNHERPYVHPLSSWHATSIHEPLRCRDVAHLARYEAMLTQYRSSSPFPRPGEAIHPSHPRSPSPRDQGPFPTTNNMDFCHFDHLLGHEPNALVRHCFIRCASQANKSMGSWTIDNLTQTRHLRSSLLVAHDDGE